MKSTQLSLLVLALVMAVSSCKKGDTGPQGPTGNANVTMYTFGSTTFTGSTILLLSNLSQSKMDSSMVLVYYNPVPEVETSWYPVPGLGSGGQYETRYFVYAAAAANTQQLNLRLVKPDGSGAPFPSSVTFRKIRVFVAPASSILPGGRTGRGNGPDLTNYYDVLKYFNLPE